MKIFDILRKNMEEMRMEMGNMEDMGDLISHISVVLDNLENKEIVKFSMAIHKLIKLIRKKPHLLGGRSGELLEIFFNRMKYLFWGLGPNISLSISSSYHPALVTETPEASHIEQTNQFIYSLKECRDMKELMGSLNQ